MRKCLHFIIGSQAILYREIRTKFRNFFRNLPIGGENLDKLTFFVNRCLKIITCLYSRKSPFATKTRTPRASWKVAATPLLGFGYAKIMPATSRKGPAICSIWPGHVAKILPEMEPESAPNGREKRGLSAFTSLHKP